MATYPTAVLWDLSAHDYTLDGTTGSHVEAHPVDAAVMVRIGFRKGSVAGCPDDGHTLDQVDTGQNEEQMQRDIEGRQVASLGSLIVDGLIDSVVVTHSFEDGRLSVLTRYRNVQTAQMKDLRTSP